MLYFKLALIAMQLLQYFVKLSADNKLIEQGRAKAILENLESQNAELKVAGAARQKVRDIIDATPGSVLAHDQFERDETESGTGPG